MLKTKKLCCFISVVIMVFSLTAIYLPELNVAKADSDDMQTPTTATEQLISEDLSEDIEFDNQYDAINYIEGLLNEAGSSILSELYSQLDKYNKLLEDTTDADDIEKLHALIAETERLITANSNAEISMTAEGDDSSDDEDTDYSLIISAAIAFFNLNGYDLASEMLTHMSENTVLDSYYEPLHIYRLMSSDLTYELALDTNTSGGASYEKDGTVNGNDLYYAIHDFSYKKSSSASRVLIIQDDYNYDYGDYDGLQQTVVNMLYNAQKKGALIPYKIKITFDAANYLRVENLGKNDDGWRIKISNYSASTEYAIYNELMCFEDDAKNWSDLTNINYVTLSADGGSAIVTIKENVFATSIAICRVSGINRYITYANELDSSPSINQYINMTTCNNYGAVNLIGKNGNTWLVKITNTYLSVMNIEYNSKMCFESDAKNWELDDVKSLGNVAVGASKIVKIEENALATNIAIKFTNDTKQIIFYANSLNKNCTMNVSTKTTNIYQYLSLINSGKSGSTWKIKIYNPTSSGKTVYYNSKMCFENDAKNWSGLSDVKSVYIPANTYVTVYISTNVFATCITTSYINSNGVRVISYANGLNTSDAINVMYNYVNS